ncbi:hypothetical protein [uncultured Roseobacter sp.]|uniref:hypothetical protein n=1 Tax=uncultured Roseobacter sp. TaxID=114847 RepID=UPI00261DC9F5|nr:hypothetical protein [uncultured Roseobacter sp.]
MERALIWVFGISSFFCVFCAWGVVWAIGMRRQEKTLAMKQYYMKQAAAFALIFVVALMFAMASGASLWG